MVDLLCIQLEPFVSLSDIDECSVENGGCSQVCVNKPGSFECRCMKGYQLQDDKMMCEGGMIY